MLEIECKRHGRSAGSAHGWLPPRHTSWSFWRPPPLKQGPRQKASDHDRCKTRTAPSTAVMSPPSPTRAATLPSPKTRPDGIPRFPGFHRGPEETDQQKYLRNGKTPAALPFVADRPLISSVLPSIALSIGSRARRRKRGLGGFFPVASNLRTSIHWLLLSRP